MTPDTPARAGLHPSIVLSAYIEPLLRGRRVAVFGDATIGLVEELGKRGARLVHVYDPDPSRAGFAMARALPVRQHAITYAVFTADLGVRDGAFDLIVIPDLSIFSEPSEILRRARRLLSPSGAAVIVTPNLRAGEKRLLPEAKTTARAPNPPGYYELYDLVSLQFAKVRMIGQAPFVGYTIADFAPRGEPEVSVDTSFLASSEEPEHFIAIAADRPVVIDAYAVVALPWAEVGAAQGGVAEDPLREDDKLALTDTRTRLALMSAELEKVRDRQEREAREAEARATTTASLSAKVVELELTVAEREARARELEGRAGDNHVRAERLSHQIRDLEEELRRQRERGTKLTKALDDEKKARTKAELELGMIRGAPAGNPKDRERIEALMGELEASQSRVSELEGEMVQTRRRGQLTQHRMDHGAQVDATLRDRVSELEESVNSALREASDAAAERDLVIMKLRRAEAKVERMVEVEADLAASEAAKALIAEHHRLIEGKRDEAERRIEDLERRLGEEQVKKIELGRSLSEEQGRRVDLERSLAEERRRKVDLERGLAVDQRKIEDLERRLGEGRRKIEELSQLAESAAIVAESAKLVAEAEQLRAETEDREAAAVQEKATAEAALEEIAALEGALRDRGHAVAALQRDLRESDRIGRELLAELDAARGGNGNGNGVATVLEARTVDAAEDLRARLDVLAEGAARSEADLQAARWQIARLTRDLAEGSAPPREPSAVQRELEAALAAARDEVAALRRASGAGAASTGDPVSV